VTEFILIFLEHICVIGCTLSRPIIPYMITIIFVPAMLSEADVFGGVYVCACLSAQKVL